MTGEAQGRKKIKHFFAAGDRGGGGGEWRAAGMRWRGRVEGKIFACFGGKYLLWCGVNAAGEVAANVQGESLKAAAVNLLR